MRLAPAILSIILSTAVVLPARAATFDILRDRNGFTIVVVQGEFMPEDGTSFANTVSGLRAPVLVAFDSPGGAVVAGLQMGLVIRSRGFVTAVTSRALCASACALAWLGGKSRLIQGSGRVGFHAAFNEVAGQKIETGSGNALVGAYLNELGLSFDAILYVEKAHPDDITWLTPDDADSIGIRVRFLPELPDEKPVRPETPSRTEASPPSSSHTPMELPVELVAPGSSVSPSPDAPPPAPDVAAREFAQSFFAHWSEANPDALGFFRSVYADRVSFYGRTLDRSVVLQGKNDFARRWPVRVYSAKPDGLHVFCDSGTSLCTVSGIVHWDCRNPGSGARTAGAADFSLTLRGHAGEMQITVENGSVISREPG
ncbi:hypothetical protein NFI95_03625 [Acetobacteraceae bacterium KSS8]|uniref:Uncharacterized protein n=1 Tax=Endosaccharibacter trunci TaxID=2812733 RepID=A0ABT1W3T2_9PROT|nr:hypothetical protein [Acetobacteraceae bacterium KSS8]